MSLTVPSLDSVLGDQNDIGMAKHHGIDAMFSDGLKKLNKNKKSSKGQKLANAGTQYRYGYWTFVPQYVMSIPLPSCSPSRYNPNQ